MNIFFLFADDYIVRCSSCPLWAKKKSEDRERQREREREGKRAATTNNENTRRSFFFRRPDMGVHDGSVSLGRVRVLLCRRQCD